MFVYVISILTSALNRLNAPVELFFHVEFELNLSRCIYLLSVAARLLFVRLLRLSLTKGKQHKCTKSNHDTTLKANTTFCVCVMFSGVKF